MGLKSIYMAGLVLVLCFSLSAQPLPEAKPNTPGDPVKAAVPTSPQVDTQRKSADIIAIPMMAIPKPQFNFGTVLEDDTVTAEFIVRNTGSGPLAIEKVKTG